MLEALATGESRAAEKHHSSINLSMRLTLAILLNSHLQKAIVLLLLLVVFLHFYSVPWLGVLDSLLDRILI